VPSADAEEMATVGNTHTVDRPPSWLPYVAAEHQHTREHVSLFDVSSFAKLLVQGPGAKSLMQRLCCADVSAMGRAHYTGMLNAHGGYETDVTVTRVSEHEFLVISPTAQATRDADWIRRNICLPPQGGGEECVSDSVSESVIVSDVTGATCVLALMGPKSRALLERVALPAGALDDDDFPFGAVQDLTVGHVAVRAARMTYVGELGYELYVPAESAAALYSTLHEAAAAVSKDDTISGSTDDDDDDDSFKECERRCSCETAGTTPLTHCVVRRGTARGGTSWACRRRRCKLDWVSRSIGRKISWARRRCCGNARRNNWASGWSLCTCLRQSFLCGAASPYCVTGMLWVT